jgi:hypothetical protein
MSRPDRRQRGYPVTHEARTESRHARPRRTPRRRPLAAEGLEDRALMTILYTPQNGAETASDGGGAKLGTVSWGMPLYSIFLGSYWSTTAGQQLQSQVEASLNGIFYDTAFLSGLHQYGVPYPAGVNGSGTVEVNNNATIGSTVSDSTIQSAVSTAISSQGMPDANSFSNEGLYLVFTPPNVTNTTFSGDAGVHTYYNSSPRRHYAWIGDFGGLDSITYITSHEVMEAMTDPNGDAWQVAPRNSSAWNEIADNEAQNYSAYLAGYDVQSHWSQADGAYSITDGNSQTVTDNNHTLTVNGDQLGSGYNDTVTVDLNSHGGVLVTLNGQSFSFPYGEITHVTVNTGGGTNTVNVLHTSGESPVTVNGGGTDTDNIGYGNSMQGINGSVTVDNPPNYTTLNLENSADTTARTVSFYNNAVYGLAPASIFYTANDVSAVNVYNGAGSTTNVYSTPQNGHSPTTTIDGISRDTVNVGDSTGVQDIAGTLNVVNPPSYTTLNINDAADTTARTVTVTNSSVTGLAPAAIDFVSDDLAALNVTTSDAADTVNVPSTSLYFTTSITGDGNGTVNVGSGGSVQDVLGTLNIENPPSFWTINVDDSADTAARTVTLDTFTPSGDTPWGSITGLAPAPINYEYNDTTALNLTTGTQADTVNVRATGATTNLFNGGGGDVVNVGSAGSVQNILGALRVDNNPSLTTLTVDDSADTAARTVTLDTFTPSGDTPWASIVGLSPASISYEQADVSSPVTIDGGSGGNTFNVVTLPTSPVRTIDLNAGGGSDTVNVQATAGALVINGQGGTNTLVGPNALSTWNVTGTNAGNVGVTTFSNVQNLAGGTANDVFKLSNGAGVAGTVTGGGGSNTLNEAAYTTPVAVNLAAGTATGVGGYANILTFVGGTGSNTLTGPNAANTWVINAANGGTVAGELFTSFGTLVGGTANDLFTFNNGKTVSGTVTGGGGTDTLNYAAYTTPVTVSLPTGTATGTGGISGITNVTGGTGNDHLTGDANVNTINGGGGTDVMVGGGGADVFVVPATEAAGSTISDTGSVATIDGPNAAATWTVTGVDAGNVNGVAFTGVANLVGGTGTDSFKFNPSGALVGTVNGGAGAAVNTLDYSTHGTAAVVVNLAASTATGTHGFSAIGALIGSPSAADKLVAANVGNNWTLTGSNAGTVGALSFSAVENLVGGTNNDTFKFNPGGGVTGTLNSGGGTLNTLNYSAFAAPITVNLATGAATGTGGVVGMNVLVGSGSSGDTLVGPNTTNAWSVTNTNAGKVNAFTFSAVANLTGGTGLDVFKFTNGQNVAGSVNGGGGGDWLDYALYTTPVTVNLATGAATGVGGTASNILGVRGGSGGNTLTGNAAGNILIGGTGADTIHGGGGRSILIGDKGADAVTGGGADDIIVGGWTNDDASSSANDLALEKVLAEWQSADIYTTRVADIKAGTGLTGGNKLVWASTVHDDLAANILTGGAGTDWFFKGIHDTITDLQSGEQVN